MMDSILKMTIYWHLKYSCQSLFFMREEEKEMECRKAVEIISKDLKLWEFLKSCIGGDESSTDCIENLDLKISVKGLRLSFIEGAILKALKDADYLIRLQKSENAKIPLLTKSS